MHQYLSSKGLDTESITWKQRRGGGGSRLLPELLFYMLFIPCRNFRLPYLGIKAIFRALRSKTNIYTYVKYKRLCHIDGMNDLTCKSRNVTTNGSLSQCQCAPCSCREMGIVPKPIWLLVSEPPLDRNMSVFTGKYFPCTGKK